MVLGVLLFVLGTAVVVTAALFTKRLATVVQLDEDGLTITSAGQTARAAWAEITGMTSDHRALYLQRRSDDADLQIVSPRPEDPRLAPLANELTRRLEDSRGFHAL